MLRDGFGFLLFVSYALLQRRLEMFVLDLVEGGELIRQRTLNQERIADCLRGHFFGRACWRGRLCGAAERNDDASDREEQCGDASSWRAKQGRRKSEMLHKFEQARSGSSEADRR